MIKTLSKKFKIIQKYQDHGVSTLHAKNNNSLLASYKNLLKKYCFVNIFARQYQVYDIPTLFIRKKISNTLSTIDPNFFFFSLATSYYFQNSSLSINHKYHQIIIDSQQQNYIFSIKFYLFMCNNNSSNNRHQQYSYMFKEQ